MTVVNTNVSQIPFVELNEETREFKFEYGTQLVEHTYLLSSEISPAIFLGNLANSIAQNTFPQFLSQSISDLVIIKTGNTPDLSDPMLLALSVAAAPNPDPADPSFINDSVNPAFVN